MRAPRASADMRAGRPRSQGRKPAHASLIGKGEPPLGERWHIAFAGVATLRIPAFAGMAE